MVWSVVPEPLPRALTDELVALVGEDGVITDPSRLLVYESDALTACRCLPRAIVFPVTTKQASGVLSALSRHGVAFVPRGAGTGLSGGALAVDGSVLVGTARMDRILELDAVGRLARVQAGVVNADLTEAARPHGLHYAPDPSSQSACTLGGNVAENAGGPHCLKYGVTARWVTGLTLVLPDGRVTELGGWGKKPPGFDLVGVVVGSEGCFGLVTEIEVRLLPTPASVRTLLAIFEDVERAAAAVTEKHVLPEVVADHQALYEMLAHHDVEQFEAGFGRDVHVHAEWLGNLLFKELVRDVLVDLDLATEVVGLR